MELLGTSRNNFEVAFEMETSHAATHFADTPELKLAVIEAVAATDLTGDEMFFEYDFDRVIGTTDLVETSSTDEIVFAKRTNRSVYTRFTKSQSPQECSTVTVSLRRYNVTQYLLWSAWIGHIGPAFPGDENETAESLPYWSTHALVWGRQEVQPDSETVTSPW